ncbi:hypothetical protein K9N68_25320 [Kovacikia minuta CCNUW1]|uniref:hypothetical protein n=1 Tax=Kovacikia minuta TaxID=2931930 RepID=UPI001CCFEC74|nr:hypothetical protein K9N68_25320 [Kovacikia minuta CCNUW1]
MLTAPIRILLQTTLPTLEDDWSIWRFSLLKEYLDSLQDEMGKPLCQVIARDRKPDADGDDPILSTLDRADFDELWLFALDVGDGLSRKDCAGITRFHRQGGGILTTRDHQDMGLSMCALEGIGEFHYFNTKQNDPDPNRRKADDTFTATISFPNYHSGKNGDYQAIQPIEPIHELLVNPDSPTKTIQYFPAHPHEGGVGVAPDHPSARAIALGTSKVSGCPFNLIVAGERTQDAHGNTLGRVIAQSTFHHFVDYNWDIDKGCPSFVTEAPGDGYRQEPEKLDDIKAYVKNLALWLVPKPSASETKVVAATAASL